MTVLSPSSASYVNEMFSRGKVRHPTVLDRDMELHDLADRHAAHILAACIALAR